MAWTDEQKTDLIAKYKAANPTPANSTEIIKDLAEEFEQSANGVRMILVQAGAYVKKTADAPAAAKTASGEKAEGKTARVSKEDSIAALKAAIEAKGGTADDDILSKLTGKAAIYFTGLFAL